MFRGGNIYYSIKEYPIKILDFVYRSDFPVVLQYFRGGSVLFYFWLCGVLSEGLAGSFIPELLRSAFRRVVLAFLVLALGAVDRF